jgi:aminopeptidase N
MGELLNLILYSKRGNCFQLNENFEAKRQLLELALATENIQVRQAVGITNTKKFQRILHKLITDCFLFYLWNIFRAALSLFGEI